MLKINVLVSPIRWTTNSQLLRADVTLPIADENFIVRHQDRKNINFVWERETESSS